MLSKWSWIVLNLIICVSTAPQSRTRRESDIKAFLHLLELDYEDACYSTNNVHWSFITSPSNETLSAWVNMCTHFYSSHFTVQVRYFACVKKVNENLFGLLLLRRCNNRTMQNSRKHIETRQSTRQKVQITGLLNINTV